MAKVDRNSFFNCEIKQEEKIPVLCSDVKQDRELLANAIDDNQDQITTLTGGSLEEKANASEVLYKDIKGTYETTTDLFAGDKFVIQGGSTPDQNFSVDFNVLRTKVSGGNFFAPSDGSGIFDTRTELFTEADARVDELNDASFAYVQDAEGDGNDDSTWYYSTINEVFQNSNTPQSATVQYVDGKTGDLTTLTTNDQSNLTNAINEVDKNTNDNFDEIEIIKGVGWTNETIYDNQEDIIEIKGTGWTNETIRQNAVNINTNSTDIGDKTQLKTVDKDNLVEAINEVDTNTNTNATNIATNESNISSNASRITSLESNDIIQDSRLDYLETNDALQDSRISQNETNISTNTANISSNENRISNNEDEIDVLQVDLQNLSDEVDTKITGVRVEDSGILRNNDVQTLNFGAYLDVTNEGSGKVTIVGSAGGAGEVVQEVVGIEDVALPYEIPIVRSTITNIEVKQASNDDTVITVDGNNNPILVEAGDYTLDSAMQLSHSDATAGRNVTIYTMFNGVEGGSVDLYIPEVAVGGDESVVEYFPTNLYPQSYLESLTTFPITITLEIISDDTLTYIDYGTTAVRTTTPGDTAMSKAIYDTDSNGRVDDADYDGSGTNYLSSYPNTQGAITELDTRIYNNQVDIQGKYDKTGGTIFGTMESDEINFDGTNTAVGRNALTNNTSGTANTTLGYNGLISNTEGSYNVALGQSAMSSNTTGDNNIGIGYQALNNTSDIDGTIGIGAYALQYSTSGQRNTAIGLSSMRFNTTGNDNVAIGYLSLNNNTSASGNVAIGYLSLVNNETGGANVGVGRNTLNANVSGERNTAIGTDALYDNTASYNTAVGYRALYENTSGINNQVLGDGGLQRNTTGSNNIAIGRDALAFNISGSQNTSIGVESLKNNTSSNNTAVGYQSLNANTSGSGLTAVGYQSLKANTDGISNTAVGRDSLVSNTSGGNNVAVGRQSLQNNNASNNTAVGFQSLNANTTGTTNTAIGYNAMLQNTTGDNNTAMGRAALGLNLTGNNNTAIGWGSLLNNTASNNTAVGFESLTANTSGANNVAMGYQSLVANIDGNFNVALGDEALKDNTTGDYNYALGFRALQNSTSSNNIGIGFNAGTTITNGFTNVLIGNSSDVSVSNAGNQIVIGYQAIGKGNNTVQLGNSSVTAGYIGDNEIITDKGGQTIGGDLKATRFKPKDYVENATLISSDTRGFTIDYNGDSPFSFATKVHFQKWDNLDRAFQIAAEDTGSIFWLRNGKDTGWENWVEIITSKGNQTIGDGTSGTGDVGLTIRSEEEYTSFLELYEGSAGNGLKIDYAGISNNILIQSVQGDTIQNTLAFPRSANNTGLNYNGYEVITEVGGQTINGTLQLDSASDDVFILDTPSNPYISFQIDNVRKGYIGQWGNDMRLATDVAGGKLYHRRVNEDTNYEIITSEGDQTINGDLFLTTINSPARLHLETGNNKADIQFTYGGDDKWIIGKTDLANDDFWFYRYETSTLLQPALRLKFANGDAVFENNVQCVSLTETSRQDKKTNILEVNTKDIANDILSIPVKKFFFNHHDLNNKENERIGLIIEDIEEIIPEERQHLYLGETDEDSGRIETIKTNSMLYGLLATVQELKKEIDALKEKLGE